MRRRRLRCPDHGVITEGVPFARHKARFTRVFEDLVVWLCTRADRSTVALFARVTWRAVGSMCERVAEDLRSEDDLAGLVDIGVDEISWRKHHKYLTLVSNHADSTIVWGAPGKDAVTLDGFFAALPAGGADRLESASMDMSGAFQKSVRTHAPNAVICFDPFHVIGLATDALDAVRRRHWRQARHNPDPELTHLLKGARWALLKNPTNLTYPQAVTLARIRGMGGQLIRAYQLKESLRAIFAGDITDTTTVLGLLTQWLAWASRSKLPEFVKAARTIRSHLDGITAAITRGISNGRHEGLNSKIRTMLYRAHGFHSPHAALALINLACGPRQPQLPYHTR
jgi:transposase